MCPIQNPMQWLKHDWQEPKQKRREARDKTLKVHASHQLSLHIYQHQFTVNQYPFGLQLSDRYEGSFVKGTSFTSNIIKHRA